MMNLLQQKVVKVLEDGIALHQDPQDCASRLEADDGAHGARDRDAHEAGPAGRSHPPKWAR